MTEQQAQSPLDDLFRKTFENLPESPAESGWDTPSDRVWQHVQSNIQQPRKGWGAQSLALFAAFAVTLAIGLYWMFFRPAEKPATTPSTTPTEQPAAVPSASEAPIENVENQVVSPPKPSTGTRTEKETPSKPAPHNSTEEQQAKPGNNAAQPLPGSKPTLPPNSTEAQKKKPGN
ncbi:MAG: hypothetical protein ACKVUS_10335 [Saprospiraceae bacterium]